MEQEIGSELCRLGHVNVTHAAVSEELAWASQILCQGKSALAGGDLAAASRFLDAAERCLAVAGSLMDRYGKLR